MEVGMRIKKTREEKGITQEELGRKLGVGKSAICRVENGNDNLSTARLERFAEALDVSASYLMGWDNEPHEMTLFDIADIGNIERKPSVDKTKKNFENKYSTEESKVKDKLDKIVRKLNIENLYKLVEYATELLVEQ